MRVTGAVLLWTTFLAVGCSVEEEPAGRTQAPPAPAVVVAELSAETVPIYREFVARTDAVETVEIQARVEAILESMEFEEGRPVTKGQELYRLDKRTYTANLAAAEANLAQAKADLKLAQEQVSVRAAESALAQFQARLKKAQQDVARLRPLSEKDAVPRQDLDAALAAEEVAVAEVQAQEALLTNAKITEQVGILMGTARVESAQAAVDLAKLDLEYCTVTSPIDGLIGRTEVDVGNLVGRGLATTLATVSSIDPIYVTFAISEAEYLMLMRRVRAEGQDRPRQPVELILADDSVFDQKGEVITAERAVEVETGTLQLVAQFPNPDRELRSGQFGRVRIEVDQLQNAVLVPQRAVMEQQGAKVVFLVGEGDVVSLRTIQVSERYESFYAVTEGLSAGERVIVEGQLKARPGMTVKPMDKAVSAEPGQGE